MPDPCMSRQCSSRNPCTTAKHAVTTLQGKSIKTSSQLLPTRYVASMPQIYSCLHSFNCLPAGAMHFCAVISSLTYTQPAFRWAQWLYTPQLIHTHTYRRKTSYHPGVSLHLKNALANCRNYSTLPHDTDCSLLRSNKAESSSHC